MRKNSFLAFVLVFALVGCATGPDLSRYDPAFASTLFRINSPTEIQNPRAPQRNAYRLGETISFQVGGRDLAGKNVLLAYTLPSGRQMTTKPGATPEPPRTVMFTMKPRAVGKYTAQIMADGTPGRSIEFIVFD